MLRNFIGIIVVVGLIVVLASNGSELLQWGQNFFASKTEEVQKEDSQEVATPKDIAEESQSTDAESEDAQQTGSTEEGADSAEQGASAVEPEEIVEHVEPVEPVAIPREQIIEGVVKQGDTVGELLKPYDTNNGVHAIIQAADDVFSPKKFRIGQPYTIVYDTQDKKIISFTYEIDKFKVMTVKGEKPKAYLENIVYDKKLTLVESDIKDNLFLSVTDAGESAQLAMQIADIFAWEINFIRDIQPEDSFAILVEKLYREGEFKGYGRAIGATFTNKGKTYSAYLYHDAKKISGYYSREGQSLKKVLLQSPLSFTRVTSGYTKSRKHPIFGTYRPHLGIDYGAPTGTPVMAVGDGTVKLRGWVGGYGYQVVVRHSSGYESMYSHLSRFPKNIRKGTRVRQGQVIGYVGSTGISTGPHLDFRLKRNGKFINPSTAMSPRAEPITKGDKKSFEQWVVKVREFMNGTRTLESYTEDMLKSS